MSLLLEPYTLRQLTLPNRIAVSPMCQYSSVDGLANDWHLVHLGSRAIGGAGLIFTEATAITADGRITAQDLGLWDDQQIEPLQRITRFIAAQGLWRAFNWPTPGARPAPTGHGLVNTEASNPKTVAGHLSALRRSPSTRNTPNPSSWMKARSPR